MRERSQTHNLLGVPAVFCSAPIQKLLETAERVAKINAAVLITGESGSGKELIARAVHHFSMRCTRPWVDVNCAALPEHLIESELFGYEKGAFSGADSPKTGLFELAHGGTLFLDEIGELEPRTQVKLLRVLDGVPYYRLGGTRKHSVDARIIAASNQDLEEAIKAGRFRKDLFHRLDQIHLRVPPLRQRVEDIVPLAEFFLEQQDPQKELATNAKIALQQYSWPGNVRELRNAIIKAALATCGFSITAADLPAEVGGSNKSLDAACFEPPTLNLDLMERNLILSALERAGGHHQRAATFLGISRRTLSRKLKIYGFQNETQVVHA